MYFKEMSSNMKTILKKIARRTRRKVVIIVEEIIMLNIVQAREKSVHLDVNIYIVRTLSN